MKDQTIKIDEKVISRLERWIINQESINLRTKKFTDSQMVSKIKDRIEEEVKCYLSQSN